MRFLNLALSLFFLGAGALGYSESPESHGSAPAGSAPHEALTARQVSEDHLAEEIASRLRGEIRESVRPVYTYHYANRNSMGVSARGPLDSKDARVSRHVQNWAAHFWDPDQGNRDYSTDAQGLYLASDPVTSRDYGDESTGDYGDSWALFRVILPRGLRVLDMRKMERDEAKVSEPLRKELAGLGCSETDFRSLVRGSGSVVCRRIGLLALRKLGADAIDYEFPSANFKGIPERPYSAIILINTDRLSADSVAWFGKAFNPNDGRQPERQMISTLYGLTVDSGNENAKHPLWPAIPKLSDAQAQAWVRKNLMGEKPWLTPNADPKAAGHP